MTELRQPDGRLPLSATGIENAQRSWTTGREQGIKILPQDRLAQLPFRGAIYIAGKLLRDVIEIAILHLLLRDPGKTAILSHPR